MLREVLSSSRTIRAQAPVGSRAITSTSSGRLSGAFVKIPARSTSTHERALVWNIGGLFTRRGHGEGGIGIEAPILVSDGKFDREPSCPAFEKRGGPDPADVRDFVVAKMREHLIELHRQKMGRKRVRRDAGSSARLKGFSKMTAAAPLR